MTPRRSAFALAILLAAPAVCAVEPPGPRRPDAASPSSHAPASTEDDAAPVEAAREAASPADARSRAAAAGDPNRSRRAPVDGGGDRPRVVVVSDAGRPVARGVPISLSVRDADLVEVLRSFARIAGWNLVVDPSVRGTVTAELENVPWDRALAVILKTQGLGMELDGRVIIVAPPARLYPSPR